MGRLTADPDTRAGEKHETRRFRLAIERIGTEEADFIRVIVFDRTAQIVGEHLTKGRLVSVTGRLRSSEWTTPDASTASASKSSATTSSSSTARRPRPPTAPA